MTPSRADIERLVSEYVFTRDRGDASKERTAPMSAIDAAIAGEGK